MINLRTKIFWIGWLATLGLLAGLMAKFDSTAITVHVIHILFGYHLALAAFAGLFWHKGLKLPVTKLLLWALLVLTFGGSSLILLAMIFLRCIRN